MTSTVKKSLPQSIAESVNVLHPTHYFPTHILCMVIPSNITPLPALNEKETFTVHLQHLQIVIIEMIINYGIYGGYIFVGI